MVRAGLIILGISLGLSGCGSDAVSRDNPYAPGIARSGGDVDHEIVGHRLMAAGEYDLAIKAFSRAALEVGMSADLLTAFGSAYLGMGRLGEAEETLRHALKLDETSAEAWNNLGVVLMEKNQVAEAEQMFRRAYALDNGESDSVRDNLRLTLAKNENPVYDEITTHNYKVVRRGSSDFIIREIP